MRITAVIFLFVAVVAGLLLYGVIPTPSSAPWWTVPAIRFTLGCSLMFALIFGISWAMNRPSS